MVTGFNNLKALSSLCINQRDSYFVNIAHIEVETIGVQLAFATTRVSASNLSYKVEKRSIGDFRTLGGSRLTR